MINDVHCHFFSRSFLQGLAAAAGIEGDDPAGEVARRVGWDAPLDPAELAGRWTQELEGNQVHRAALIASLPGDEDSVTVAVERFPHRFVGFFMLDPTQPDALGRLRRSLAGGFLRTVCLFPSMHRYSLGDERVREVFQCVGGHPGCAVFVHCGVLSIGVRKKLGLPSRFDIRYANPLDLNPLALDYPEVPLIIPHFGAGFFREALMLAQLCPNVYLDTSSSNSWIRLCPGLTLRAVFETALQILGADRLLFGTDSSFFPRGWNREIRDQQDSLLSEIGCDAPAKERILGGNFDRLFPPL